jgi:ABC-type multidrug transport system fused ATPase/permease subunit
MKKLEIKEVNLWSVVRIAFFIFIVIGLLMGLFSFVLMMAVKNIVSAIVGELFISLVVAIIYAALGTLFSFVIAFFYNLLARLVGGISVEVAETAEDTGYRDARETGSGGYGQGEG